MKLVIVESPTKAKTISRFLGNDFVVKSSYGHVRDLPKSKIGVDVKNQFEPTYIIPEKSKAIITELAKDAKKAALIVLATDEDREGEAIAFHLAQALELDDKPKTTKAKPASSKRLAKTNKPIVERIVFHEITEQAIRDALANPRKINLQLVNAQQARRILDRLIGYELSPFLWRKIHYGLSAGRVQSAALRLLVERERERKKFQSQEYWSISVLLQKIKNEEKFEARLTAIDEKELPKPGIPSKEDVEKITADLECAEFSVAKVIKKETMRRPLPPFTTSTLQQTAWQWLRFSSKQTMLLAQQLYENGHITYMRTDSVNLSTASLEAAQKFLAQEFTDRYCLARPRIFVGKSKLAQEAHEAIRPTSPSQTPEKLKSSLAPRQYKLYDLIWRRFLATQMPEAVIAQTQASINASSQEKTYNLKSTGQTIVFDGFLRVWRSKIEERLLPDLVAEEKLSLAEMMSNQHFTEPPPRYTDGSLVKALEEHGIGRPSTYSPTIATLEARNYIERDERKALAPTGTGTVVTELLEQHFSNIVDYGFTAAIENQLDDIAHGEREWVPVIKEVYEPFHKNLLAKENEVTRKEASERPSDEKCDKCASPMVTKYGRFGPFLGCSDYPKCKNIKKIPRQSSGIKCPKCGEGEAVMRRTKAKKRIFYGCSKWPSCDYVSWKKPPKDDDQDKDA